MGESIDGLLDKVERNRVSVDPAVDAWANERLVEIRTQMLKLEREGAYRRHMIRYIKDEYFNRDDRDEPLCTCGNNCPLIRGELPPRVEDGDTLQGGIETFAIGHPGHPTVLYDADEAWRETKAEVITELQRIWTHLKNNSVPDADTDAATDETPPTEASNA